MGLGDTTSPTFAQFVLNILTEDFTPILWIIGTVSYLIGLCLIIIGITRLHRHAGGMQNMMQRSSPMSTAMYFVVGVIMIAYVPYLQMLSDSLFGTGVETALFDQCTNWVQQNGGSTPQAGGGVFQTNTNTFCPMMAYTQNISDPTTATVGDAIQDMFFGLMFLVGVISFIRGLMLLIRLGEGGGQGQGVGRAFTFIFAGIVGTNIDQFYGLMQNILTSNASGS